MSSMSGSGRTECIKLRAYRIFIAIPTEKNIFQFIRANCLLFTSETFVRCRNAGRGQSSAALQARLYSLQQQYLQSWGESRTTGVHSTIARTLSWLNHNLLQLHWTCGKSSLHDEGLDRPGVTARPRACWETPRKQLGWKLWANKTVDQSGGRSTARRQKHCRDFHLDGTAGNKVFTLHCIA